jgi:hypothetical protein
LQILEFFVVFNVRPICSWFSQFSTWSLIYEDKSDPFNFRETFFSISWEMSPWTIINRLQKRRNTKKNPNSFRHKHDDICCNISKTFSIFCTGTLFLLLCKIL